MKSVENKPIFKERAITEVQWYLFLGFMGLLTRLPMLRLAKAETTDGILSLTYFSPNLASTPRFVILPGYPALLWLTGDSPYWGRFIAAMAGLLFLIPLWKFCRRWVSVELTGMVCTMALFSPLLWQWSLKVMPDTVFLLFFWWALERMVAAFVEKKETVWVQGNIFAALSACTRPEGFLLLPWIFLTSEEISNNRRWIRWILTVFLWMGPLVFLMSKFPTILDAYKEGAGLSSQNPLPFPFLNFVDHFYNYLIQPVFAFTPLIYWFAILGLGEMVRRHDIQGKAFRRIILQPYIVLLLSRFVPVAYQDRYLLPFLPVILVAAVVHLENHFHHWGKRTGPIKKILWKNGLLAFCIGWLAVFSAAVLIFQNDSFGDIRRSSEFLKTLPESAVIYSDEIPKTQYWSQRKVKSISLPFHPQKGDYVVFHSFYTPRLSFVQDTLYGKFGAKKIQQDQSMVVPLLTDTMMDPTLQNRIKAAAFRFEPQFFISSVYQITGKPLEEK